MAFTDDDRVRVRTSSSATSITSEPDRLLVRHASSDTVRTTIPRTAPRIEVQIGTRRILLREGTRLTVAPDVDVDPDGPYVAPLRPDGA